MYEENTRVAANQGAAEIIVAKHRNGPTDSIRLAYLRQFTRFENLRTSPE